MKPTRSLRERAWGSRTTVTAPHVQAHAAKTCTVGESADHCGALASIGSSRMRLSSCTGYIAMRTVAATFHVGGGAIRSRRPSSPLASSLEGNQPPRLPSSFCKVIFSASMSIESSFSARPRSTPLSSHALRRGLCLQRERSLSLVKMIATVSGWSCEAAGIWTQWKHERTSEPTMYALVFTEMGGRWECSVACRMSRPSRSQSSTSPRRSCFGAI
mmetsp:Transcript_21333/g.50585  ORF Transcript_21333/g.50585 Transcript_21333/m.50585 type:complete len:216 (-) Transcript_21333:187-834(-)